MESEGVVCLEVLSQGQQDESVRRALRYDRSKKAKEQGRRGARGTWTPIEAGNVCARMTRACRDGAGRTEKLIKSLFRVGTASIE